MQFISDMKNRTKKDEMGGWRVQGAGCRCREEWGWRRREQGAGNKEQKAGIWRDMKEGWEQECNKFAPEPTSQQQEITAVASQMMWQAARCQPSCLWLVYHLLSQYHLAHLVLILISCHSISPACLSPWWHSLSIFNSCSFNNRAETLSFSCNNCNYFNNHLFSTTTCYQGLRQYSAV